MSMHKKPLTDLERSGLNAHGLPIGKPSQLSDCFRSGIAWAQSAVDSYKKRCSEERPCIPCFIGKGECEGDEKNPQRSLAEALEREQALAAHVEAITAAGDSANWDEDRLGAILGVLYEAPATSLAKRDLIKQAEALEWMANKFDEQGEYRGYALKIEERAADLRQQADVLTNEATK